MRDTCAGSMHTHSRRWGSHNYRGAAMLRLIMREVLARVVQRTSQLQAGTGCGQGQCSGSGSEGQDAAARPVVGAHHSEETERPRSDLGREDSLEDAEADDDAQHLPKQRAACDSGSGV